MPKIEIYSTANCPFCINAKMLLQQKGYNFEDIRVDADPVQWQTMQKRANGARSVPQIFINDFHVGGFEDMAAMNAAGKLDQLLEK